MAMPFIARVITIRTKPVAAAFKWNSCCGLDTQLNIWMGMSLNGEKSHAKEIKGNSALSGESGKNAIKVKAPMVIRGALSPMALDSAMMTPVKTPPMEKGE